MTTGAPHFFQCWKCRRHNYRNAHNVRRGMKTRVRLTGETRKRQQAYGGANTSMTNRQYECQDCGHVGWSNHMDLERVPDDPSS